VQDNISVYLVGNHWRWLTLRLLHITLRLIRRITSFDVVLVTMIAHRAIVLITAIILSRAVVLSGIVSTASAITEKTSTSEQELSD
jgi:hypothetical protein